MKSAKVAPIRRAQLAQQGLADYKMQEPMLQEVLPHLGLANLARLRACCSRLHSLLASEPCAQIWLSAAQHHPPSRHLMQRLTSQAPSIMPHQQASSSDSAIDQSALQQQQQQERLEQSAPEDKAVANPPCDASSSPLQLQVQRLLQEQGALLRKLSQGGSMSNMQVPLAVRAGPSSETWSPCNTWVAIVMEESYPWDTAGSTLWIWNRVTGATQKMELVPQSHILTVAWLPASSYLVWVKGDACDGASNRAHKYTHQSIFCLDVASQQKHQLLDQPCSCQKRDDKSLLALASASALKPVISASACLLAYVQIDCVKLLSLPHLEDIATLTLPVHPTPKVAAMSFNPAGTHIAITWDGKQDFVNFTMEPQAPPFQLDVFATDRQSRRFNMPWRSKTAIWYSWNPTISHLLMVSSDEEGLAMLDVDACTLTPFPGWNAGVRRDESPWTADGSMAIVCGSNPRDPLSGRRLEDTEYNTVLCNGTLAFKWIYGTQGPRFLQDNGTTPTPPQGMQDDYRYHRVCLLNLYKETDEMYFQSSQRHREYLSTCGHLVVTYPRLDRDEKEPDGNGELVHLDMDYGAHTATEHLVTAGFRSIPRSSLPIWHPSPAGQRIYAVIGQRYDVWLIDGQQHRVLRHWRGKDLLRHTPCAIVPLMRTTSWHRLSWSEDGTKLLLVGYQISIAIDFCSPSSRGCSGAPVRSAWRKSGVWAPWDFARALPWLHFLTLAWLCVLLVWFFAPFGLLATVCGCPLVLMILISQTVY